MTKKLEELFNLPPKNQIEDPAINAASALMATEEAQANIIAIDAAIDKIDAALPTVKDLEASDAEMDELSDLAKSSFKDMMDLAMNVEPRFSGPILQSASTLLGHAITAKMAKMDKKLKMVELQIKKARVDQNESKDPASHAVEGKGMVLDRNELLKSILAANKKE